MRKVLVATHGRFAEGIRETMQFIMGDEGTVDVRQCIYKSGI